MISPGESFGQINFGHAELGDKRRTKKLVDLADLMSRRPGGALPQKLNNPKDLKAFYRLMNSSERLLGTATGKLGAQYFAMIRAYDKWNQSLPVGLSILLILLTFLVIAVLSV